MGSLHVCACVCVCMYVGTGITDAENKDISMAERAKQVEPHCQVKWTAACYIYN